MKFYKQLILLELSRWQPWQYVLPPVYPVVEWKLQLPSEKNHHWSRTLPNGAMIGSNVTSTTTKRQLLLFLFFLPFVSFFIFSVNLRLARLRSHVLHCMLTDQHMPAPPSLFCSVVAWNDKSKAESLCPCPLFFKPLISSLYFFFYHLIPGCFRCWCQRWCCTCKDCREACEGWSWDDWYGTSIWLSSS